MYFIPETPRYLILILGKVEEGREAVSQLRESEESSTQVEAEFKEILAEKGQAEDKETTPNKTGMEESTEWKRTVQRHSAYFLHWLYTNRST